MKYFSLLLVLSFFPACEEEIEESPSLVGSWEQFEKKTASTDGWQVLPQGFFWNITFNEDGSHTNSQGNFMSTYDCTGTWVVNGNRLTLVNDCGRKKQDLNMHFSIEDSILSWVYEFSDNGEKFKRK